MNLACNISEFEIEKTTFLDIKKNIIIDGTFTKLIYSTSNVILNGIYLIFPIEIDEESYKKQDNFYTKNTPDCQEGSIRGSVITEHWQRGDSNFKHHSSLHSDALQVGKYKFASFSILNQHNINIMKELSRIEHTIIEYAKYYYNIKKINIYSLRNQLKHGSIKIYNSMQPQCDTNTIIKISGIWENDQNIGITYKFIHN